MMPNTQTSKTPMPTRDPKERVRDFGEVATGYTAEMAINEAARCLDCKNSPCVSGCPVGIAIPRFIRHLKSGDCEGAYRVILESSSLPAVCGRVCPQESQCESKCVRGIKGEPVAIGRLERYAADAHVEGPREEKRETNGRKVAVIGSGPSGLACAASLAGKGYAVTVFEALHEAGGVLTYGIPGFRLPGSIVKAEIGRLTARGVKIEKNTVIGRTLTVDELFENGFEAVFIGTGAGLPSFMGIPGESLCGVYSANEFLTRVNLMRAYEKGAATPVSPLGQTVVVGGGNVAMDAARTALRMGASGVKIVYRRGERELPARKEEVEHAKEEGVEFCLLRNPVEILGYENEDRKDTRAGRVRGVRVIRMELGEPDERGRRRPVEVRGSEYDMACDTLIMAIGTSPNPLIKQTTAGLETDKKGCLVIKEGETGTSRPGVFAGGDAVTGAATVILAMGAGKKAAEEIDGYLKEKRNG